MYCSSLWLGSQVKIQSVTFDAILADFLLNFYFTQLFAMFLFSPSLQAMNLPILTCSYCMRKVGMWSFFQMETVSESENPPQSPTSPAALTPSQGTSGEKGMPTSPSQSPTPCRMKLRSQDPTRSEQVGHLHLEVIQYIVKLEV